MILFGKKKKNYDHLASINTLVWKRFKKVKPAIISLWFVVLFILIAILGYLITPDQTPYCNQQYLELSTLKPGEKILFFHVQKNEAPEKTSFFHKMLYGKPLSYDAYPIYKYWFSGNNIIIEEYTGSEPNEGKFYRFNLANVAYALSPGKKPVYKNDSLFFYDFDGNFHSKSIAELQNQIKKGNIVTHTFYFGTDRYGRDVLSQIMIGSRVSLSVGFIAIIIALFIGITLGAIAAYYGKWVDNLIVWFINVVWSIPTILLVIAITFALGKGFWQVFIAVGLTMWVDIARVVRGQILSIKEKEFVEAGKALGYKGPRIIFKHILPNITGAIIVITASNFASAILLEAGLSFLGIGVQPPMPSWGAMLKENYGYIILDSAYLAILPGLAIMVVVLAFMLIGNGIRDALDVKIK